jgi:hypothetical protein
MKPACEEQRGRSFDHGFNQQKHLLLTVSKELVFQGVKKNSDGSQSLFWLSPEFTPPVRLNYRSDDET